MIIHRAMFCITIVLGALLPATAGAGVDEKDRPVILIDENFQSCAAGRFIRHLEDQGGSLSIDDAAAALESGRFTRSAKSTLNFGVSASAYWLHISVNNAGTGDLPYYLEIAYPQLDHVTLYRRAGAGWEIRSGGDMLPYRAREFDHENHIFRMVQGPGLVEYYLRIQTSTSAVFPVTLWAQEPIFFKLVIEELWKGIILGVLIVLGLYNLFILFSVREMTYLYYVMYLMSYIFFYLTVSGFGFRFFWPDSPLVNQTGLAMFLTNIFCMAFTRKFLDTRTHLPVFDRLLAVCIYAGVAGAVATLFLPARMTSMAVNLNFLAAGLEFATAVAALMKGRRAAKFYLLSWIFLIAGAVERGLLAVDLIPFTQVTASFIDVSAAFHYLLFSFALADRINAMKNELVAEISERRRAEIQVTRKNTELEATNEELTATIEELEATNEEYERQCGELCRTQEDLKDSEEKFSKAFHNSPAIIGISTLVDGRYVEVNRTFERVMGMPREELIGKTARELGILSDPARARIQKAIRERGAVRDEEISFTTKRGEIRRGLFSAVAIELAGEACLIGEVNDITERIAMEESLAAEHERLAVTLASIGEGVIATDTRGRIVLVNRVAEELTGFTGHEAAGLPLEKVFRIVHEKTRQPGASLMEKVLRTGAEAGIESPMLLLSRDGAERLVSESAAPIRDGAGAMIGAVLVFRDVTSRMRMEKELLTVEKLKSVNILAGGIAHDFNNLLAAILGNINLAKLQTDAGQELYALMDNAEKACLRATGLTQQLLAFSKGGAPVKKPVGIGGLIEETALFVIRGSHVKCEFSFAEDLWPADIDAMQVSQVIQNLALNAVQAMPGGGSIYIAAENRAVEEGDLLPLEPGNYVRITVRDTGGGIEPKNLPRIFDPFFTTRPEGNGLGLSNCYSIVRNHSGHITVQSAVNGGTSFAVYLPAAPSDNGAGTGAREEFRPGKRSVLVLEDEPEVMKIAQKMFEALGMSVEVAPDGDQALEKYRASMERGSPFELVVLDLTVPGGKGGLEVIRELKALDPRVVAVVSSGYSTDPVMANFGEYGFRGVLRKPYTLADVQALLGELFIVPRE